MDVVITLPDQLAEDLLLSNDYQRRQSSRGPSLDAITMVLTVANTSATVITLSQGVEALKKIHAAYKNFFDKQGPTKRAYLEIQGPRGKISVDVDDQSDIDYESLVRLVGG